MPANKKYQNIPGWEVVGKGLHDLVHGKRSSIFALAVSIASPRLEELGFRVRGKLQNPGLLLYKKLCIKYDNEAHYQYNALMQRVTKFCSAIR